MRWIKSDLTTNYPRNTTIISSLISLFMALLLLSLGGVIGYFYSKNFLDRINVTTKTLHNKPVVSTSVSLTQITLVTPTKSPTQTYTNTTLGITITYPTFAELGDSCVSGKRTTGNPEQQYPVKVYEDISNKTVYVSTAATILWNEDAQGNETLCKIVPVTLSLLESPPDHAAQSNVNAVFWLKPASSDNDILNEVANIYGYKPSQIHLVSKDLLDNIKQTYSYSFQTNDFGEVFDSNMFLRRFNIIYSEKHHQVILYSRSTQYPIWNLNDDPTADFIF